LDTGETPPTGGAASQSKQKKNPRVPLCGGDSTRRGFICGPRKAADRLSAGASGDSHRGGPPGGHRGGGPGDEEGPLRGRRKPFGHRRDSLSDSRIITGDHLTPHTAGPCPRFESGFELRRKSRSRLHLRGNKTGAPDRDARRQQGRGTGPNFGKERKKRHERNRSFSWAVGDPPRVRGPSFPPPGALENIGLLIRNVLVQGNARFLHTGGRRKVDGGMFRGRW